MSMFKTSAASRLLGVLAFATISCLRPRGILGSSIVNRQYGEWWKKRKLKKIICVFVISLLVIIGAFSFGPSIFSGMRAKVDYPVTQRGLNYVDVDYGNGTHTWASMPQAVWNGLVGVPYIFIDKYAILGYYQVQSGLIGARLYNGYTVFYDPNMTEIRVASEQWFLQHYNPKMGGEQWHDASMSNLKWSIVKGDDYVDVVKTWDTSYSTTTGVLTITFHFAESLKHTVTWVNTSVTWMEPRFEQYWTGIVGQSCVTSKNEQNRDYAFRVLKSDGRLSVFESQFSAIEVLNFTEVDLSAGMKKASFVFSGFDLSKPITVDPDTATLNNPTEDGYLQYDGSTYTRWSTESFVQFFWTSYPTPDLYYRGYVEWGISSIPDSATIDNVAFLYHGSETFTLSHNYIYAMANRPSTSTNPTVYTDAADGTAYLFDDMIFVEKGTGKDVGGASGPAWDTNPKTDLQSHLSSDWFAFGFYCSADGSKMGANLIYSEEYTSANPKPTLYVTYTSNTAPTNDQLTLDLTEASYKGTKTLLAGKQDYKFVYKCSDAQGVTDITYAEIRLDSYAPSSLQEHYNTGDEGSDRAYSTYWIAQTFTVDARHTVTSVKLKLYKKGNPGTVTVSIRATDGTHPTGSDLTVGTTDGNTLPTASPYEWRQITLTSYALSANTKYAIVVRAPGGDGSTTWVRWVYDYYDSLYAGGNYEWSQESGDYWSSAGYDFMFEVWGSSSKNVILRATRGSGDTWTFSEYSDPSNYVTLNTAGSSHSTSGNQKTFNFLVKINWNWDDAETLGVRAYVIDSASASDQDDYAGTFGVENDLTSSSLTVNDYRCNPSGPTYLIDSYSETNQGVNRALAGLFPTTENQRAAGGQCFQCVGGNYKLAFGQFYLYKAGNPTGTAYAKLYAMTGTYGSSGKPTGNPLATSDGFDVSTLTTGYQLITFTFSGTEQYAMTENAYYVIVFTNPTSGTIDTNNFVFIGSDTTSPTHAGNYVKWFAGAWSCDSDEDCCFYVYVTLTGRQTLTFSGYLYYEGTSIPPPDGDYQVKVKLGTQKGSTDTTLVGGAFSIDVVTESSVGSYSYTVEATYMMGAGAFSAVIVDRIKITFGGIVGNTIDVDAGGKVWYQAIYEYDSAPFTGSSGTLYLNGTAMTWETNCWTYAFPYSMSGSQAVFHITSVTESTYGLTVINNVAGDLVLNWATMQITIQKP